MYYVASQATIEWLWRRSKSFNVPSFKEVIGVYAYLRLWTCTYILEDSSAAYLKGIVKD